MKILIAEDDDTSRDALVELLVSEGHDLVAVANGGDAVRKLRSLRPDLMILDYSLADMTGLEILSRAMTDLGPDPPPVLLLTGDRLSTRARAAAEDLGVRIFSKPVSTRDLLSSVQSAASEG